VRIGSSTADIKKYLDNLTGEAKGLIDDIKANPQKYIDGLIEQLDQKLADLKNADLSENDMFNSLLREAGDVAGVFEQDENTCYFYLYRNNHEIIDSIHVLSGIPDFKEHDVSIKWNLNETMIGLFIHEKFWAVFDCKAKSKYGGNYALHTQPDIPIKICDEF
jgi:hypothetical protein